MTSSSSLSSSLEIFQNALSALESIHVVPFVPKTTTTIEQLPTVPVVRSNQHHQQQQQQDQSSSLQLSFCAQTIDASKLFSIPFCYDYHDDNNIYNNHYYYDSYNNNNNTLTYNTYNNIQQQQQNNQQQQQQKNQQKQRHFFLRHLSEEEKTTTTSTTTNNNNNNNNAKNLQLEEEEFFMYNIIGASISILFVGLIAGLFLGLLTLDALDLEIIQRVSIDDDEIMYATHLLPIVKQRHRLLVTLLILNALAYETLPIFLDNLVPNWVAVILSTTLILLVGEIIPSAIFTGPNQLKLGYLLAPITIFFMWILTPIAVPLGKLLDYLVHGYVIDSTKHHDTEPAYNRAELSALVRIQHESRMAAVNRTAKSAVLVKNQIEFKEKKKDESWNAIKKEIMERVNERSEVMSERGDHQYSRNSLSNLHLIDSNNKGQHHHHHQFIMEDLPEAAVEQLNPPLHPTEVDLVTGALQMKTRLVMDEYTPLRKVYALPSNFVLSLQKIAGIYAKGYSRIPVYQYNEDDPDDQTGILGFLLMRQLILIDWDDQRLLSTLPLQRPDCISPRMNLVDALELLRTGGTLMAFVCARPEIGNRALEAEDPIPVEAGFMGIITLEDVMESILQGRVYDEWDVKDRDRAIATLHRWAATKLQNFVRKKRSVRLAKEEADRIRISMTPPTSGTSAGSNYMNDYNNTRTSNRDNIFSMKSSSTEPPYYIIHETSKSLNIDNIDDNNEDEDHDDEEAENVTNTYNNNNNNNDKNYFPSQTTPLLQELTPTISKNKNKNNNNWNNYTILSSTSSK